MSTKIKISIVGLGGVGGFYGGLLANTYQNSSDVEVCFLSRNQNLQTIKKQGLKVEDADKTIIAKPALISDDAKEIGVSDYIILATKTYDLQQAILQIKPMVGPNTVILPLLNGTQSYIELKLAFPNALVLQGCTYILTRLSQPGVVQNPSGKQYIYFGLQNATDPRMGKLEQLFKKAGILCTLTQNINTEIWKKYILVSASAMATTYYNASFNEIIAKYPGQIKELLQEAISVAQGLNISIPKGLAETIMENFNNNPAGSTTSMHSDFLAHKTITELDTMGGYIVRQADALGIAVPLYTKMYIKLLSNQDLPYN
ncbi:ketopantoate reductase family protein [Myroides sp. LJL116]